jgi:hypothetical protein
VYEPNGQSLVFEPEEKWRKYVKQYILSERNGKKVAVCKVDKEINYLEYNLVVFNAFNQVVKVVDVKDFVNGAGITKEVELPEETSYLSLNVAMVEDKPLNNNIVGKLKKGNVAKFVLINVAIVIAEAVCFRICLANLLGGVYRESYVFNINSLIVFGILVVGLILVNSLTTVISVVAAVRSAGRKKIGKGNKNA